MYSKNLITLLIVFITFSCAKEPKRVEGFITINNSKLNIFKEKIERNDFLLNEIEIDGVKNQEEISDFKLIAESFCNQTKLITKDIEPKQKEIFLRKNIRNFFCNRKQLWMVYYDDKVQLLKSESEIANFNFSDKAIYPIKIEVYDDLDKCFKIIHCLII